MSTSTIHTITNISRQDAEKAVLAHVRATSELERLEADRKIRMAEVDAKYSDALAQQKKNIADSEALVEFYVEQEKDKLLPGDAKSTKLGVATVGYRLSTAKVVNANGMTDDELLEKLSKGDKVLKACITMSTSIDRKKLLAAAKELEEPQLGDLGLQIVQESKFFIKSK